MLSPDPRPDDLVVMTTAMFATVGIFLPMLAFAASRLP